MVSGRSPLVFWHRNPKGYHHGFWQFPLGFPVLETLRISAMVSSQIFQGGLVSRTPWEICHGFYQFSLGILAQKSQMLPR